MRAGDFYTRSAQQLRRNMTREERHLWYDFLKGLEVPVKRQYVIGTYIVDFCIYSARIVIELDGSQHCEQEAARQDRARDRRLNEMGYTVLHYPNHEVMQHFDAVCSDILLHLRGALPSPGEGVTAADSRDG